MTHDNPDHSEPFRQIMAQAGELEALLRRAVLATIPLDATAAAERMGDPSYRNAILGTKMGARVKKMRNDLEMLIDRTLELSYEIAEVAHLDYEETASDNSEVKSDLPELWGMILMQAWKLRTLLREAAVATLLDEVEAMRGRQGDQPYQSAMENTEKGNRAFELGDALGVLAEKAHELSREVAVVAHRDYAREVQ